MARAASLGAMRVGEQAWLRESDEPVVVVAVLDAAGTLLVRAPEGEFQAARDELMSAREKHSCGCCG
jgi:hypothetical protein